MRNIGHVARLVLELLRFGGTTRRPGVVLALLLALALAAFVALSAAVAPVVIYPFV